MSVDLDVSSTVVESEVIEQGVTLSASTPVVESEVSTPVVQITALNEIVETPVVNPELMGVNPYLAESMDARITSVRAVPGFDTVALSFTLAGDDFDYIEIRRSDTDRFDDSSLVGSSKGNYTDSVEPNREYFYWFALVGLSGIRSSVYGPVNATTGVNAVAVGQALGPFLSTHNLSSNLQDAIRAVLAVDWATEQARIDGLINQSSVYVDSAYGSLLQQFQTIANQLATDQVAANASIEETKEISVDTYQAVATAEAALRSEFTQGLNTTQANIDAETLTRTSENAALSQRLNDLDATLTTQTNTLTASISNEETTRISETAALANEISGIRSEFAGLTHSTNASIAQESSTRSAENQALAQQVTELDATVESAGQINSVRVQELSDAILDNEQATSQKLVSLAGRVDTNEGSLTTLSKTVVDNESAISQTVSNLTTRVGNNESSLTAVGKSIDGIKTEYTITADANGRVAGISLISSNESSSFSVLAQKFEVVNDKNEAITPFKVVDGTTYIDTAMIESLEASKITATTLSAIQANMGTITAGTLKSDNNRFAIELDNGKLEVRDESGKVRVRLGNLADTGDAS